MADQEKRAQVSGVVSAVGIGLAIPARAATAAAVGAPVAAGVAIYGGVRGYQKTGTMAGAAKGAVTMGHPEQFDMAAGVAAQLVKSAPRAMAVGTAKAVGKAALTVRGGDGPVARGAVDAAAYVAPGATMLAGANAILGASSKQVGNALGTAAYNTADQFFKGVDTVEHKAGDLLQKATGVRGVKDGLNKASDAVRGAFTKKNNDASKPAAKPTPAPEQPAKEAMVASKTKGDGKGTYQTLDGRGVDGTPAQQAAWKARRKSA